MANMNRFIRKIPKRPEMLARNAAISVRSSKAHSLTINDMPHPKSFPIFGTKLHLIAAGGGTKLHDYIDCRHKKLGPIFYEKLGGNTKLVFISDPLTMKSLFHIHEGKYPMHLLPDPWVLYEKHYGNKRGLFFMNGEEWLVNRRVMNKHVLRDDVEKFIEEPIRETVAAFIQNWKKRSEKEYFVPDMESEFYRFSTGVIISILLGHNPSEKATRFSPMLLDLFSTSVKRIFQTTTKLYGLPIEWYQKFNLKRWSDFKDSVDMSLSLAQKLVNEILNKRHENNGLIRRLCDESMSDEMITRIVVDFVIAAGDTTAYTSLWIVYLLSNNAEVVEEIRNGDRDNAKIKHIIREAMRLYPVAPFLTRITPKPSVLSVYKLESGTPVIASIYTSGREESYFSQADQFLPYRWDRHDLRRLHLKNHVPPASLPFALGARSCIGKKIAMVQMTELIYQIVNNFDMKYLNETEVKPITSGVLVPDGAIKIGVSLRRMKDDGQFKNKI